MAPPSNRLSGPGDFSSRPGGRGTGGRDLSPGGGVTVSRPWRHLAVLVALIVVMLATVLGGAIWHPGNWHSKFKVGLGLDLKGGTSITLKAVTAHGGVPDKSAMSQAIGILVSRVNGTGVTGSQVQQQGSQFINVSIPGRDAQQVNPLLSAAVLEFRQVLLCTTVYPGSPSFAPGPQCTTGANGPRAHAGIPSGTPTIPATPTPTPSTTPTPSPSSSHSSKASASPKPTHSSSAASPRPSSSKSGGHAQAASARQLNRASAKSSSSASPKPSNSASPKASSSASPSPSTSPSASSSKTTQSGLYLTGDQSMVSPAALALFKKLDCANKNWQSAVYGSSSSYDNAPQVVACDKSGMKYVLGPPIVKGNELTGESAGVDPLNNQVVVNFTLNGQGAKAFGDKTTAMNSAYWNSAQGGFQTSVLNQFAIVLDGKIISAPTVQQPIPGGRGQITGNFTQQSANQLATVLKYGQLPVHFVGQQTQSISAQLGSSQLTAGLIAAAIGLFLVVLYSLFYYRGLALVSMFSLATAGLLSWLAVILLSTYQGYTLSLAGVAGLIVAIGITADSFIVFFERLRDEVREGRSLRAAVERGWARARRTILVSDTVSFLAALLLYIFAIGDVRGFAFTLGLTTLIDVVVVFLFTKPMVTLLAKTNFYGRGHRFSGLDPARLGARSPWRGSRPATARPAPGAAATARPARATPKEA